MPWTRASLAREPEGQRLLDGDEDLGRELVRAAVADAFEHQMDLDLERQSIGLTRRLDRVPRLEPLARHRIEVTQGELLDVLDDDLPDASLERLEVDRRLLAPDEIPLVRDVGILRLEVAHLGLVRLVGVALRAPMGEG